jgi:iron-sulfur cluster assembly protein
VLAHESDETLGPRVARAVAQVHVRRQQVVHPHAIVPAVDAVAARREADGSIVYGLGFDEPREGDMPLEVEGIQLLIAPPSQALLQAMRLDFVETQPGESGFVFSAGEVEPEAPPRRGCGGSGACGSCGG